MSSMAREIIMFTFPDMTHEAMNIAKLELERVFHGFDILITNKEIKTISPEELQNFFEQVKEARLVK